MILSNIPQNLESCTHKGEDYTGSPLGVLLIDKAQERTSLGIAELSNAAFGDGNGVFERDVTSEGCHLCCLALQAFDHRSVFISWDSFEQVAD